MNELVYSGFGAESSDQAVAAKSTTRPLWLLRPLPLPQVSPDAYGGYDGARWGNGRSRGPAESLASACLGVISQNMHTYDPNTLTSLPPHLATRVMRRVCDDRRFVRGGKTRPDDATLWTFMAFSDPATAHKLAPSHTVALPVAPTLHQLPPSRDRAGIGAVHPLVAAPHLFSRLESADRFAFLTSLQLDGHSDSHCALSDDTIGALRHATHLTALWTRGWRQLTDNGVRMLSASLVPPSDAEDAQGLWRLRAWWLTGCKGVSDRSMKSFAKWPGLVVLDIRDTSCTEVAMEIYNRANHAMWGDIQPPLQHVNDGLRGLFASDEPDMMLDKLCETLIKSDVPIDESKADTGRYFSLNLKSCNEAPADQFLPEPKSKEPTRFGLTDMGFGGGGSFKTGIGQVYGAGANRIFDEGAEKRSQLKLALELQAEDNIIAECIARGETPPERRFDREKRLFKESRKKYRKDEERTAKKQKTADRNFAKRVQDWANNPNSRMTSEQVWQKKPTGPARLNANGNEFLISNVFKDKAAAAETHSKRFVKGVRAAKVADSTVGQAHAMLVRLVRHDWETMRYGVVATTTPGEVRVRRRANAGEGIADLLLSTWRGDSSASTVPDVKPDINPHMDVKPTASQLMAAASPSSQVDIDINTKPTATQLAAVDRVPSSQPTQSQSSQSPSSAPSTQTQARHFNPFRAAKSSASGVTPLGAHICPEAEPVQVKRERTSSGVTPLVGKLSSGVTPLFASQGLSRSGVTPLGRSHIATQPKVDATKTGSGVVPLKSSGVVPLKSSSVPLKSSGVVPLGSGKAKPQELTPVAKSPAVRKTAKPKPKKDTQTKLSFFTRKVGS